MENEAQTRNGSGGDPVYEINQKEKKKYKNVEFRLCGGRLFPFFFLLKTQPRRLSSLYGKSRRDVKKFIGRLRISGHNCVRCYAWRKRAQPAGKRKSWRTTLPLRRRTRFFYFFHCFFDFVACCYSTVEIPQHGFSQPESGAQS